MTERQVAAHLIGVRYDCDDCGAEMEQHGDIALLSSPHGYPHRCPNGHTTNLARNYPGYDIVITHDPLRAPVVGL